MRCIDCGKEVFKGHGQQRCEDCQLKRRLGQESKRAKLKNRWLTRLGGTPISNQGTKNYKGGIIPGGTKVNEAQWRDDVVNQDIPIFNDVETMEELNKKDKSKKRTLKKVYEDWKDGNY